MDGAAKFRIDTSTMDEDVVRRRNRDVERAN
jgi:hypothetical protein